MNSYEEVKEMHEAHCFKLRAPRACVVEDVTAGEPHLMKFLQAHRHFHDKHFHVKKADGSYKQRKFMRKWLADKTARTVDRLTVDATGCIQNAYNLWKAPLAAISEEVEEGVVAELVQPIVQHIEEVICDGSPSRAKQVLGFLSNIIKHRRADRALYVYGDKGCGASVIFKFFCSQVLGPYNSFQTYKPSLEMQTFHRSCVLVGGAQRVQKSLNSLITKKTVCYRQKNSRSPVEVESLVNLIITAKKPPTLKEHSFDVFQCSSKRVGQTEYFDALQAHVGRADVARAFYQFLAAY